MGYDGIQYHHIDNDIAYTTCEFLVCAQKRLLHPKYLLTSILM